MFCYNDDISDNWLPELYALDHFWVSVRNGAEIKAELLYFPVEMVMNSRNNQVNMPP